jgi:molecular chaperone HtpG
VEKNKSLTKEVRLASMENTNTLDSIENVMKKKKSVSATVRNTYIPDDIAFSIQSKLPLKSLKRFECVHKSWSLLFENTHFMNMFRNNFLSSNRHYYDGSPLLLKVATWPHYQQLQVLYTLSGDRFKNMVKLDFSNPFDDKTYIDLFGFGSINGIILLHQYCGYKHVLWNPATQKFKLLPLSLVDSYVPDDVKRSLTFVSYLHGFGYDFVTDDYKVIRYLFFPDLETMHHRCLGNKYFDPLWEIYSLRSNSWRKLDVDMPPSLNITEGTHVYMDGVCHWLCRNDYGYWKEHNIPFQPSLVSFYLSNEVFFITPHTLRSRWLF